MFFFLVFGSLYKDKLAFYNTLITKIPVPLQIHCKKYFIVSSVLGYASSISIVVLGTF